MFGHGRGNTFESVIVISYKGSVFRENVSNSDVLFYSNRISINNYTIERAYQNVSHTSGLSHEKSPKEKERCVLTN